MQMGYHVRMMSAIDLHFLDINRTTNIDPALIRYVENCQRDTVNFGTVDQMRMHFILTIQTLTVILRFFWNILRKIQT